MRTGRSLVMALLVCFVAVSATAEGNRIALVIGNSQYDDSPLRNPENDARDVSRTLQSIGFDVSMVTNADKREMLDAIREFGRELLRDRENVGLFYFAGHGMQVDGANFLIPVGTNIAAEDEVEFEAVDMGLVLGKMNTAGNVTNILIIDACRDNPFARSFRSGSRGLAVVDAPTGILIAYATAPGEVAADGTGRNGAFTEAFLDHVNTPDVDVELMFRNVRQDVMLATSNEQTPWTSSSLMQGFAFVGEGTPLPGPGARTPLPAEPEPGVADESIDAEKAIAERRLQAAYEELLGRVDQSAYDAWVRRNGYQTIAMDGSTRDKIVLLETYLEENPRLGIVVPLRAGVLIADGIGIEIGAGIGYMISPRFGMGLGLLFGLAEGFAVGLDPHAIVMFSDTFGVRVGFQGMPEYINDFGGPSVGVIINDLLVIASIDVLGYGGFILSTGYNISF